MQIRPPQKYASEFYDLESVDLTVPSGPLGFEITAWWKTASSEECRDLLHRSRGLGLAQAFAPTPATSKKSLHCAHRDSLIETDEDDDDLDCDDGDYLCSDEYGEDAL